MRVSQREQRGTWQLRTLVSEKERERERERRSRGERYIYIERQRSMIQRRVTEVVP